MLADSASADFMRLPRQVVPLVSLIFLCLGLAGCRSGAGLFFPVDHHPELMLEARAAAAAANPRSIESVLDRLDRRTSEGSHLLYLLEAARLKSLLGELENSVELYAQVEERFDDERIRATFTASESLQTALSMVTNDRALPYNGQLFERLLVYTFQALNHLQLGNPDLARIELNKALRDMRWGKENLPQLRRESDQSLSQAGVRPRDFASGFSTPPDGLVQESSSDNALVYYLSGLLFEAVGDLDRAAIDYRNALAYAPGSPPVEAALNGLGDAGAGAGRLIILHESDWVSPKIPFSLAVFIKDRSYTLSFPYYTDRYWSDFAPESFLRIGETQPLLYPLLNVDAAARAALQEQFSAILLRQALRMVAKEQLQNEAQEADPWLGFAASIFSILSDSPDLRSWLSLPSAVYVADLQLPAGNYPVDADLQLGRAPSVVIAAGRITVLRIVSAQGRVISIDSFPLSGYLPQP
jgi:hypothetical protein